MGINVNDKTKNCSMVQQRNLWMVTIHFAKTDSFKIIKIFGYLNLLIWMLKIKNYYWVAGRRIDRSLCLITLYIIIHFQQHRRNFLQTGFAGFCTALFSELQKIIFAKPNSNPDKGVVVHEEQELIKRKHFLHAFCFGKKI